MLVTRDNIAAGLLLELLAYCINVKQTGKPLLQCTFNNVRNVLRGSLCHLISRLIIETKWQAKLHLISDAKL